ncbi:MAG: FAD binding domain-containing protein [Deltaproteobacteria bacterium]|nr:FAD binding domain-containing protein [Deltaproteobacteria bacterium]
MRLPYFDYATTTSLPEVLSLLNEYQEDAVLMGGGTDLIPTLKRRLLKPRLVIDLARMPGLRYIRMDGPMVKIGAAATLDDVLTSDSARSYFPALIQAVASIGAVSIQHHRATLVGNLMLNTRCRYYNQSQFWRSGKAPCFKAGGQTCFAEERGEKCRSVYQSDGGAAILSLAAMVHVQSLNGDRIISAANLFTGQGEKPFKLEPSEMVTEILLPIPVGAAAGSYQKLRFRSAIDYPLVGAAATVEFNKGKTRIESARLALTGISSAPLLIRQAGVWLVQNYNPAQGPEAAQQVVAEAARLAMAETQLYPVDNIGATAAYRQKMIPVMARRAITAALK